MPADATGVTTYDYELLVEVEQLSPGTEDALYETHDVLISSHGDVTRLTATANGHTAVGAASRLLDQLAAVDAKPKRFVPDLVTRAEIAIRAGVSRQAVSNWTRGERKAAFPSPLSGVSGGVWCYGDVVPWLTENLETFSEPCRHLTWTEFSEVAPLANSTHATKLPLPVAAISEILDSSRTDPPAAVAPRIRTFIQNAANGGSGQRDPVNDLLEQIAQHTSVAQRSVIADSLPTVLQANLQYSSDPKLEPRFLSLSLYFANSLGGLATERDKVRIERAIRTLLEIAVTRKETLAISALLSSLAFSPYKVPSRLLERAVDLVGIPAYADAFLAMLATDATYAVDWLFRPFNNTTESGVATDEAVAIFRYSIVLMSKSPPRHAALSAHDDRRTAVNSLLAQLVRSTALDSKITDNLLRAAGIINDIAASFGSESDTTALNASERAKVERLTHVPEAPFEQWPPMPSE